MKDRRAYHQAYYREHKAQISSRKAWQQKHDLAYRLRAILRTIVQRCDDPRHASYKWYGAKGIQNHLNFDMLKFMWIRDDADKMKKPSIDREDPSQDYTFGNCCFRELYDNQKRGWENKQARTLAISKGMKMNSESI